MHLVLFGLDFLFPHFVVHLDQVESFFYEAADDRVLVVKELKDYVYYLGLLKHDFSSNSEQEKSVVSKQNLLDHFVVFLFSS